jgi:2-polyprenyl-6-methoxyphenol hydroxylase-like FAD-dependent oxidoreductase
MKFDRRVPVAIVGGGAAGTILAAQLAKRGIDSALIDGSGRAGRGVAYSTIDPAHLLNVRAEGMSAWAGEPRHFANRFADEGGDRREFAERRFYGEYLRGILHQAVASGHAAVVDATAVTAAGDGTWRVELDDGTALIAPPSSLQPATRNPSPYVRSPERAGGSSPIHGERKPGRPCNKPLRMAPMCSASAPA